MGVDGKEEKIKFTVAAEEDKKVATYSVTVAEEGDLHAGDEGAEVKVTSVDAGASEQSAKPLAKSEGIVSIPANNTPKNYNKEFIYIALLAVLCAGGALLAYFIETYKYAGIILAVLSLLAAAALVRHVFESKKVSELVSSGKCKTVSELMTAMKKTKRADFLRTVGGMIKDGHLTGYAVLDDEYFVSRPPKDTER